MATQQIRFWSDPNRNKTITVTYVDAPDRRVYFEVAPIDPDQNMAGGGLPQDGFVAGEVLTSFCEGPDLVSFRASNVQPYALIDVTPDSPTCQGSTPAVKLTLDSLTSTDETAAAAG